MVVDGEEESGAGHCSAGESKRKPAPPNQPMVGSLPLNAAEGGHPRTRVSLASAARP